jgi:hypothetical protein
VLKHCTSDTFKRLAHGYIGGIELFGGVGAVLTEIEKAAISSNIEMELECAPSNLLPKMDLPWKLAQLFVLLIFHFTIYPEITQLFETLFHLSQ